MDIIKIINDFKDKYAAAISNACEKTLKITDIEFQIVSRLRWLRQLWKNQYVIDIAHDDILTHVRAEGLFTSRFAFMVFMSCAIAMLGLLLSSPSIITGAMLISPLMSPIMSLGFSLCVLDTIQMRKALNCLIGGVMLTLVVSWFIVKLSPLNEPTPEILYLTQPNLFHLLVAIFSGMAGGYSVIKRKGETIVGVAIATALMPPLVTVGFGLVTGNNMIAKGAFMLFMTNLLAISLSVTLVAKFYGFGLEHSGKHTMWQVVFAVIMFGILSIPLGVALKNIAYQTYITKVSQDTIKEYFGDERSRVSTFKTDFTRNKAATIDAVVMTSRYRIKAQSDLKKLLADKISSPVILSLDQVIVAQDKIEKDPTQVVEAKNMLPSLPKANSSLRAKKMVSELKEASFFPIDHVRVNIEKKIAIIYSKPDTRFSLVMLHQFEKQLTARYSGWVISIIPAFQALPSIYYKTGTTYLFTGETEKINAIIWTLNRWKISQVSVAGFSSTMGATKQNRALAYRRAAYLASKLKEAKISATSHAEYSGVHQVKEERKYGINRFQRAEVRLINSEMK